MKSVKCEEKGDRFAVARERLRIIAVSGMGMTCGACGHFDDMSRFVETEIAGALPPGTFQCPQCRHAFERRMGTPTVHPSGWIEPGAVSLERIAPRM